MADMTAKERARKVYVETVMDFEEAVVQAITEAEAAMKERCAIAVAWCQELGFSEQPLDTPGNKALQKGVAAIRKLE